VQGYKSKFRSTLLKVNEPVFIGVVVSLMSLGSFYCILLFCYDSITEISSCYYNLVVPWSTV